MMHNGTSRGYLQTYKHLKYIKNSFVVERAERGGLCYCRLA
jgi:hypothetical protein